MKKTSQEIMNEIVKQERIKDIVIGDAYLQQDILCKILQAQRQERLECYKKFIDKLEKLPIAKVKANSQVYVVNTLIAQLIFQFKQEIKILEGEK